MVILCFAIKIGNAKLYISAYHGVCAISCKYAAIEKSNQLLKLTNQLLNIPDKENTKSNAIS